MPAFAPTASLPSEFAPTASFSLAALTAELSESLRVTALKLTMPTVSEVTNIITARTTEIEHFENRFIEVFIIYLHFLIVIRVLSKNRIKLNLYTEKLKVMYKTLKSE